MLNGNCVVTKLNDNDNKLAMLNSSSIDNFINNKGSNGALHNDQNGQAEPRKISASNKQLMQIASRDAQTRRGTLNREDSMHVSHDFPIEGIPSTSGTTSTTNSNNSSVNSNTYAKKVSVIDVNKYERNFMINDDGASDEPTVPPPCRVFKFDNFSDQQSSSSGGTIVDLAIDDDELIFYSKTCEKQPKVETVFIDEIADVFIGGPNDSSKQKNDTQIQRKFGATFSTASNSLSECLVTVMHGLDFVNAQQFVFLTKSVETSKTWCRELRKFAIKYHKRVQQDTFYYWRRHFAKLRCTIFDDELRVCDLLDSLLNPSVKAEERKALEKHILRNLPILKDKKKAVPKLLSDPAFLFRLYKCIMQRSEVEEVFAKKFGGLASVPIPVFRNYLVSEHRDKRLNEVLHPPITLESASKITAECQFGQISEGLTVDGFLRFLISRHNFSVHSNAFELDEESMKNPLAQYYINSSHNTYLKRRQMKGTSSVSMYRYALMSGCRSVELDCWDGQNNEPIITHGPTHICFCTTILFKDVIQAISETAFLTSDYPVILSFENHCSQKQQVVMAKYCREILGDLLLTETLEDYPIKAGVSLPSPYLLKRKILIKNKIEQKRVVDTQLSQPQHQLNMPSIQALKMSDRFEKQGSTDSLAGNTTDDETTERSYTRIFIGETDDDDQISETANVKLAARNTGYAGVMPNATDENDGALQESMITELSELVTYMRAMGKFTGFSEPNSQLVSSEMYSMNETKAIDLLKQHAEEFTNHNKRQITRVYPKGHRVDSSNYMPLLFWNCGCQMAAINLQTPDLGAQINSALFEMNGKSGYILKPACMRKPNAKFDPFELDRIENVVPNTVSVTIISGQFFCLLSDRSRPAVYVEMDLYGLPGDSHKKMFRTTTINSNGLNTIFDIGNGSCKFSIEKIILPALAFVRFGVYEDYGGSRLLAQRILPVASLQPGYKHIILRNHFNKPIGPITLFVHVDIQDYVNDAHKDLVKALQNPIEAMKQNTSALNAEMADSLMALSRQEQNRRLLEVLERAGGDEFAEKRTAADEALMNELLEESEDVSSSFDNDFTVTEKRKHTLANLGKAISVQQYSPRDVQKQSTLPGSSQQICGGISPGQKSKYPHFIKGPGKVWKQRSVVEGPQRSAFHASLRHLSSLSSAASDFAPKLFRKKDSTASDAFSSGEIYNCIEDSPKLGAKGFRSARTPPPENGLSSSPGRKHNNSERKYTALSEYMANKQFFFLENFDVTLPSIKEFEKNLKVYKLQKSFAKKCPSIAQLLSQFDQSDSNDGSQHELSPRSFERSEVAMLSKYLREKEALLLQMIEERKKNLTKKIEITYQNETKELQKINAKSRMEELGSITKKSNPIEYKRLSDKYVRRGIEESRKILTAKEKKLGELDENEHHAKMEVNKKIEEDLAKLARLPIRN